MNWADLKYSDNCCLFLFGVCVCVSPKSSEREARDWMDGHRVEGGGGGGVIEG